MSAFVNYFADDSRSSPFNLAVVRVLLGAWVLWRVVSLDWGFYGEWPDHHVNDPIAYLHQDVFFALLPYQQWVVAALLVSFIVGYKIRWTGGLASLLLMHMLAVKSTIYLAGTVESLFVCAYFILLFAFFHEDDVLSVDALLRTRDRSLDQLNAFLTEGPNRVYRLRALKWGLVVVGLLYLGAAWGKIMNGPLEIWLSGAELRQDVLEAQEVIGVDRPLAAPIFEFELLGWIGFVGTALVQLSLLVAVLLGLPITLSVLGLLGFHASVIAMLGLYFIDMFLVLSLFVAWDVGYRAIAADSNDAELVYDDRCGFCVRSLYLFKHLDINDSVRFYSRSDVPTAVADRDDVDLDAGLSLVRDGEVYGGYEALRQLLRQFRIFAPLTLVMGLSPVRAVGHRAYEYLARNRSHRSVSGPETNRS
ncbi:thiol-disulfide oxidoreductase DCC family protein [Natronococcus occultus]|uniref:HTTM domain-containing protein n=1 Tax=Natronococcus occultus SP4 TaxID=694430 RepID=L0K3C9_9EURY|nr:DUF393 domain-containing protein [Natronococcus occultus]AGB38844.1 hypothetical protein Natoc_3101 [Natronococcus occultus SP4]